jgi:hypothetical protein
LKESIKNFFKDEKKSLLVFIFDEIKKNKINKSIITTAKSILDKERL